jgi:hypothetical protein
MKYKITYNLIISAFILNIAFIPRLAYSQEVERVTTISEGSPAPFSGTLFSTLAAAKILTDLEFTDQSCQLKIDKQLALKQSEFDLALSGVKASLKFCADTKEQLLQIKIDQINFLHKQIEKRESQWPQALIFVGGVIVGGLITLGIAHAVVEVSN